MKSDIEEKMGEVEISFKASEKADIKRFVNMWKHRHIKIKSNTSTSLTVTGTENELGTMNLMLIVHSRRNDMSTIIKWKD